MKQPLIITTGIVIILLVLGVWVFLILFGTPEKPSDVFSDLGIIDQVERPDQEAPFTDTRGDTTLLSLSGNALQQLTTEQVAGFSFATSTVKTLVRYAERGTGHLYEIDLVTGAKKQISRTTIPNTVEVVFSPNASVVVFISEGAEGRKVTVGEIPENLDADLQRTLLPSGATNISFEDSGKVLYTHSDAQQTIGYTHNIQTQTETELFTIGVPDLVIKWGSSFEKVYAYTKPTRFLEGSLYTIENSRLTPVADAEYGLVPVLSSEKIIITSVDTDKREYQSTLHISDVSESKQPIVMLPEKCVFDVTNNNFIWCATELSIPESDFLEKWYKGVVSSQDFLWHVNLLSQTAELILDPENESGRALDILNIVSDVNGEKLLFTNKIDNTLWLYDTISN